MHSDDERTHLPDDGEPRESTLREGQSFGQYRIVRLLGRGGMGEVYEAEHAKLGTRHALKLISPEVLGHAESRERFEREAKVMARLGHPNIVHVDDFGESDGQVWLRMELVRGGELDVRGLGVRGLGEGNVGSLADLMIGEPLPEWVVADLLSQILDGLGHAHEQGVVHRDLKPSNILLTSSLTPNTLTPNPLQPKISDFGLVSMVGADWLQSRVQKSVARSMTQSDATALEGSGSGGSGEKALLGTYAYMSPEQKRGEAVDQRSDLYSVGLIGFQMLTGEQTPGFEAPSELVEGVDPGWDAWVKRALAARADRRFLDAAEMRAALPDVAGKVVEPGEKEGESTEEASAPAESAGAEAAASSDSEPSSAASAAGDADEGMPEADSGVSVDRASATKTPTGDGIEGEREDEVEPRRSGSGVRTAFLLLLLLGVGGAAWYVAEESDAFSFGSADRSEVVSGEGDSEGSASTEQARTDEPGRRSEAAGAPPSAGSDRTVDLPGGDELELVWIDAGTFRMGSPESEDGRDDDETPHEVRLTEGYWLGKYEVTQSQWESLMGNNPSDFDGSDRPVEEVSWEDAMEFCRKLTQRERDAGRLPEGYRYTLPTESQWEYACRAGTETAYSFGDDAGRLEAYANYEDTPRYGDERTAPVGSFEPNAWGLYDMHGNVWEWCRDWYGDYPGGSVTDPTGPSSGSYRVYRGGSWSSYARLCRSALRYRYAPGNAISNLGVRLALAPTR